MQRLAEPTSGPAGTPWGTWLAAVLLAAGCGGDAPVAPPAPRVEETADVATVETVIGLQPAEFISSDPRERVIEAVRVFEDLGARVDFEYEDKYVCPVCNAESSRPDSMPRLVYDCPHCNKALHMFPRATVLEFRHGRRAADEDLVYLAGLPDLKRLDLTGQSITDRTIPLLLTLRKLERLYLSDTQVTVAGRQRIADALPDCYVRD